MPELRKATLEDYPSVADFIHDHHNPNRPKSYWKQLFCPHWDAAKDNHGMLLLEGDEILGFLGTIVSERQVDGRTLKICSLCTWVVKESARNLGLNLLFSVIRGGYDVVTDVTPSFRVLEVLEKMNFKVLEDAFVLVPPLPLPSFAAGSKLKSAAAVSAADLGENEAVLYTDHQNFHCSHYVLQAGGKQCYFIAMRKVRRNIPFAWVQYVGDAELFAAHIHKHAAAVCLGLKSTALVVDKRFLAGRSVPLSKTFTYPVKTMYHDEMGLAAEKIDNLYTEFFLLNTKDGLC
jgi:acetoacetyl-CoA synthetase